MAFCFLFLPAIYTQTHPSCTSCVSRLPRRCCVAPCVHSPSLEQVSTARGRFVALKLRSTQWKNGKCCWLVWSRINRNPGPSLRLLCLGFFLRSKENMVFEQNVQGPTLPELLFWVYVLSCSCNTLQKALGFSPPCPLLKYREGNVIDVFTGVSDPTLLSLCLCVLWAGLLIINNLSLAPLIHLKFM